MLLLLVCLAVQVHRRATARQRRARRTARLPLTRELRALDRHLDRVCVDETRRIESSVSAYLAGQCGHVVLITPQPHELALSLSDGRRIALGDVPPASARRLVHVALRHRVRPVRVSRRMRSYRLVLEDDGGGCCVIRAGRVVLAQ